MMFMWFMLFGLDGIKTFIFTSVVYRVQMIPVENKDNHMLSPVAEKNPKTELFLVTGTIPRDITSPLLALLRPAAVP